MDESIKEEKRGPVPFYTFPLLSSIKGLRHAVFTRKGGASRPPFHSMNMSFLPGEARESVLKNRGIMAHWAGGDELIFINQVHGDRVLTLKKDETNIKGGDGDGLITNIPGKTLVITVADCQGILLCDPEKRVVGNIHSGWRGSVQNILGKAANKMKKEFHCHPGDIRAAIGPALGPCCAEFVNYKKELPESFLPYRKGACHFDFRAISVSQLLAQGIKRENISLAPICTSCNTDKFFSYRREKKTGRFALAIGLTKEE